MFGKWLKWPVWIALSMVASLPADGNDVSKVVSSDTGQLGGQVELEPLPQSRGTNSLMKHLSIAGLDDVTSARLLIHGALRDTSEESDVYEWVFFNLNGYGWVLRTRDLPLPRVRGADVKAGELGWATVRVPNVNYLRDGVNELVIWNRKKKDPERGKYLVIAYDDSDRRGHSFCRTNDQWTNRDLNGDRDGTPTGEWMIRMKLDREAERPAVGPATQIEEDDEFSWGFTHTASRVFPDRPYHGALENEWTLDAARNEYESCQFVLVPQTVDMLMTEVFAGDLAGPERAVIPRSSATVRLVRTVQIPLPSVSRNLHLPDTPGVQLLAWPDPLPEAYPIDILRGRVQAFWITIHVPSDARPGRYTGELTITSNTTGGRSGKATTVPLHLRVRSFAVPTLSRYQMVAPATPWMRQYHIVNTVYLRATPTPRIYLDREDNLRMTLERFDREFEAALNSGQTSFSLGFAMTGADNRIPESFDWRVEVEGASERRRIWVCPMDTENPDADTSQVRQSRKYFTQYLSQLYQHLEEKGWTQYCYLYGADEPHSEHWRQVLIRYFALVKQIAPKLRIMVTMYPTDRFGPNVDIACIMMNHLRADTYQLAERYEQELWCYSCGHLNRPALTIAESDLGVRMWHWLQEKWHIQRVLLWQTQVWSRSFRLPGEYSQGAGDGQIFWTRLGADGEARFFPSIRAEMLRDGIEDREYIYRLKEQTQALEVTARVDEHANLIQEARQLAVVPDELVKSQWDMTDDMAALQRRRCAIADAIERLEKVLGSARE